MRISREGVLSLPFRLLLAFTIAALAFPPLLQTYEGLQMRLAQERLKGEFSRMEAAAAAVFLGGEGNVQRLRIDLRGGPGLAVREIVFGDPVGNSPAPLCVARLMSGVELAYPLVDSQVPLGSITGGAAIMAPQVWDIALRYAYAPNGAFVAVEGSR